MVGVALLGLGAGVLGVWTLVLRQRVASAKQALSSLEEQHQALRREVDAEKARLQEVARSHLAAADADVARERSAVRAELERLREHYESEYERALGELEPLRKYQVLADAEQGAQNELAGVIKLAQDLRQQANLYAEASRTRADAESREAGERARRLRSDADETLRKATEEARRIVDQAHKDAQGIAGDAYTALRERDSLEQAIRAIRSTIDGYGDRYVVPTRSLLDELAADFSHLEAGANLKTARDQSRRMVEEGHAADCDYSEARRQETAIRFVVDAFNGRVDGILSRTRSDNFGTLEQEIRDAFAIVNLNGEAFRRARIREAYLNARLDELRWGVVAQELRLREREEQRRIQEEIREEEKARREAERVMKETEREEALLQKALERARAEVESASAEERARYQQRVDELSGKLAEAEARNQRAKSMAEQTRAGNVYVISNIGSFGENIVKIGMTRRLEPMERIYELGDASVPFAFDVHAMITTDDAPALERELHARFEERRVNRVNYRKEFFRVAIHELREFVADKGLKASFTMLAEASEYRESLAIAQRATSTSPDGSSSPDASG